jgi:LPS sulfotransferase NodH
MDKYMIFSSARSGSSSLISALNHNNSNVHEPFMSRSGDVAHNQKFIKLLDSLEFIPERLPGKEWKPPVATFKTGPLSGPFPRNQFNFICQDYNYLNEYLSTLYNAFNGIKHVFNTVSITCNNNILNYCVDNKIKILFLTRRCPIKAILSGMISQQARIFQLGADLEKKEEYESFPFRPININRLKQRTNYLLKRSDCYRTTIKDSGATFKEIYYEDIFLHPDKRARRRKVRAILDFIGLPPDTPSLKDNLNKYIFNPQRKQNHSGVLDKIPNAAAILKALNE